MHPTAVMLLIGLLAGPPSPAIAPDGALLSVESPAPGTAAALRAEGVAVVRDLGRCLLVVADAGDRARLEASGRTVRILDGSVAGKTYYTATRGGRAARALPAGRILRDDGHDAVVEASLEQAEAMAAAGWEIARVFLRPVKVAPAPPDHGPPGGAPSPFVDAMVRAVSGAAIDADVQRLQDFGTRFCRSDSGWAAAEWVRTRILATGCDSVTFHVWDPGYAPNVVAVLRGWREPETMVLIGGHYDSIASGAQSAPGADDNGSGTALVLEAARVLSAHRFERTLVFIAFGGEELGLYGSEAYAAAAAARGDHIAAMINADMVGYLAPGDVPDLDVIADHASTWLRDVAKGAGARYVRDLPVIDGRLPGGASSDHASFWAHGFPAVQLWEDDSYSPFLHTSSDVVGLSYCSGELAQGFARLAVAMAAELAVPLPVAIAHVPVPDMPEPEACCVAATIVADGSLAPGSLAVHWSAGGGWLAVPLVPGGAPDEYEAWLPAQPSGSRVTYWLSAEDVNGARATDPPAAPAETHSFYVGVPVTAFADDAETDRGWICGLPSDDATSGRWVRADPVGTWDLGLPVQPEDDHTAGGACCFVTGNAPPGQPVGVNDVDGGKTTLLSPVLDLSGWPGGRVRYWRWYVNDTPIGPADDAWTADVSSDEGATWTPIETCTESEHGWRLVERDIAAYVPLTSQMRFRFVAADESTGSFVEAALDDFSVIVFAPGATPALPSAPAGPRLALEAPAPNPSAGPCRIRFTAPGGPAALRVVDVTGRTVATLVDGGTRTDGPRTVTWNGLDSRGRPVASGVYLVRLEAVGGTITRKLVRVR